jgi:hypothetical protein
MEFQAFNAYSKGTRLMASLFSGKAEERRRAALREFNERKHARNERLRMGLPLDGSIDAPMLEPAPRFRYDAAEDEYLNRHEIG